MSIQIILLYKILILFSLEITFASVKKHLVDNTSAKLIIQLNINAITDVDLFQTTFLVGLPNNKLPSTNIEYTEKKRIPFKTEIKNKIGFNWLNQQKIKNLHSATLIVSPLADSNYYYQKIKIIISFDNNYHNLRTANDGENKFLKNRIINWQVAKSWILNKEKRNMNNFSETSGEWFQFFVETDGVYSIPYNSLLNTNSNITNIDPRSISIFMSNDLGRSRTQDLNQSLKNNLTEIPIIIEGEEDGIFDQEDKIIFYGRGPSGFDNKNNDIKWHQNLYFSSNSCWLFIPDDISVRGKRVSQEMQPENGLIMDYGLSFQHFELDLINLNSSGLEWLGEAINPGSAKPVILNLSKPKFGGSFNVTTKMRGFSENGSSSTQHQIKIFHNDLNGNQIGSTLAWSGNSSRVYNANNQTSNLSNETNIFYLQNSSPDPNSLPYLDYFAVDYPIELSFEESFTFFSPIQGQNIRFYFDGIRPEKIYFWNITDLTNITSLEIDESSFSNVYNTSNEIKHFTLFNSDVIQEITDIQLKTDQQFNKLRKNSIQSDYIIIGPKEFENSVEDLLEIRSPAIYASLEIIYDEFSAGNPDPMAIRSFIQWTQEEWINPKPNYALFLGDAGYDYRNINGNSSIIVPTVQVQSSRSYATDDLLATIYGNIPEIAIGRYPARNTQEVLDFVEKVNEIENNPIFGPWRQKVTLIADDAARPEPNHGSISTGQSHTINSDEIAELIPSSMKIEKLYMMEYPEVNDASAYGVIKPEATQALFNSLNSGTGIISYIGHGSPYQLAQEKLLDLNRGDINQIDVKKRFPLWIVGTCSFGWFDDPLNESFSEELIRSKMNSASMIISTSRPITVIGNERYTKNLFENIFENNIPSRRSIGSILQSIKDGTTESQYFHLFGDPAMLAPIPKDTLVSLTISPDTLRTLEEGTFTGSQDVFSDNGSGYVQLIDSDRQVTRFYEISSETYNFTYSLPGATLFRGKFSISNSNFSGALRIPQDISYSNIPSKLLIYVHNNENEAIGIIDAIPLLGGANSNDEVGPNIIFESSNGIRLEEGDHLTLNENLIIRISDPLGINLTNEPGHEIIYNDLKTSESKILTDDYYYDSNSITTGTITFPTYDNEINLKIKAWDNANNPNEKEIHLYRSEINKLEIYSVFNFPNPFYESTQFTFELTKPADIILEIYSIGGKRIKKIENLDCQIGFNIINWDGFNEYKEQIANGVYLYHLKAMNEDESISYIGRCAKFK